MAYKGAPHFADERQAAEGMRAVRAWDITRALLSTDGTDKVDQSVRLGPGALSSRSDVRKIKDDMGTWVQGARKNLIPFDSGRLPTDEAIKSFIADINKLLDNQRGVSPGSPQANALNSLKTEFEAILKIRDTSIPLSPEHEADAEAMLNKRNRSGALEEDYKHPLNADGTTRSTVDINNRVPRITEPAPVARNIIDSTHSDTFTLFEGEKARIESSEMGRRHFEGQYQKALDNAGIKYELVVNESNNQRVKVLIPEGENYVNIISAMHILDEKKGKSITTVDSRASELLELLESERANRTPVASTPPDPPRGNAAVRVFGAVGKSIPLVGFGLVGIQIAINEANAAEAHERGELTDAQYNAILAAGASLLAAEFDPTNAGAFAVEEAAEPSLKALGVPEEYRYGTTREAIAALFANDNRPVSREEAIAFVSMVPPDVYGTIDSGGVLDAIADYKQRAHEAMQKRDQHPVGSPDWTGADAERSKALGMAIRTAQNWLTKPENTVQHADAQIKNYLQEAMREWGLTPQEMVAELNQLGSVKLSDGQDVGYVAQTTPDASNITSNLSSQAREAVEDAANQFRAGLENGSPNPEMAALAAQRREGGPPLRDGR